MLFFLGGEAVDAFRNSPFGKLGEISGCFLSEEKGPREFGCI